jgi:hypothetical protein
LLAPLNVTLENASSSATTITDFESGALGYVIGDNHVEGAEDFLGDPSSAGYFSGFSGSFVVPGDFPATDFSQVYFRVSASANTTTPPPILVSVPEPGSLTLLGIGAMLLAARRTGRLHA